MALPIPPFKPSSYVAPAFSCVTDNIAGTDRSATLAGHNEPMSHPRFLPDDLAREVIAEEVRANETHVAIAVRDTRDGQYRRRIHLADLDSDRSFVLVTGTSPRWIPANDQGFQSAFHEEHRGKISFLHDGGLWVIAPEEGATPSQVAEVEEGPITDYEWSPDGLKIAFRVRAHSAPYNAAWTSNGKLSSTRQTRANEISDGRGHHGSERHQLFVGWPTGPQALQYADLTGHLTGKGEPRPGNREVGLFSWCPDSYRIAFTANYEADADQHPGQLVYVSAMSDIFNYDDYDPRLQISPAEPTEMTSEPRFVTSLGWHNDFSVVITTPGPGREEVPGAHNTLGYIKLPNWWARGGPVDCMETDANIGFTPLFGAGTHQGGAPRTVAGSFPVGAPEGWGTTKPRTYFQVNTGSGSILLSRDEVDPGPYDPREPMPLTTSMWMTSPRTVFDDPNQSVRTFDVVPRPVVLDERKNPQRTDRVIAVTTDALQPSRVLEVTPGRAPRTLFEPPSPLQDRALPTVRTVLIPTEGEKRRIPAVVYEPPAEFRTDETRGICYLKGGPTTVVTTNSYLPEPLLLASMGFTVVAPNLIGSDLGDEDETLSLHTQWGKLDLWDAQDVVTWMRSSYNTEISISGDPIGLIGMSAGAHTAAALLMDRPEDYACAGLERSLLNMESKYLATDDPQLSQPQFGRYSEVRGNGASLLARLEGLADKLPPLAFLQGDADHRTSIDQTWLVFNGLRMLSAPGGRAFHTEHERYSFNEANHMVGFTGPPEQRSDYYWTVLTFMHNNLTLAPQNLPPVSRAEFRTQMTGTPPPAPPPWRGEPGPVTARRVTPPTYQTTARTPRRRAS